MQILIILQLAAAAIVTSFTDSTCETLDFLLGRFETGSCYGSDAANSSFYIECESSRVATLYSHVSSNCEELLSTQRFQSDTCTSISVPGQSLQIYADCSEKFGDDGYLGLDSVTTTTTSRRSTATPPSPGTKTPLPSNPSSDQSSSPSSGLSSGAIIGIVIGIIVFLILLFLGYWFYARKGRNEKALPSKPAVVYVGDGGQMSNETVYGGYPAGQYGQPLPEQQYGQPLPEQQYGNQGVQAYGNQLPQQYGDNGLQQYESHSYGNVPGELYGQPQQQYFIPPQQYSYMPTLNSNGGSIVNSTFVTSGYSDYGHMAGGQEYMQPAFVPSSTGIEPIFVPENEVNNVSSEPTGQKTSEVVFVPEIQPVETNFVAEPSYVDEKGLEVDPTLVPEQPPLNQNLAAAESAKDLIPEPTTSESIVPRSEPHSVDQESIKSKSDPSNPPM